MPGTLARSSDLAHFGIPPPIEAADIDEATLLIREALQAQADVAGIRRSVAAAEDAIAGQERLIRDTYRDFGLAHTPGPDEYTGADLHRRALGFRRVSELMGLQAKYKRELEARRRRLHVAETVIKRLMASSRMSTGRCCSRRTAVRLPMARRPVTRQHTRTVARVAVKKSAGADSGDGPAEPSTLRLGSTAAGGAS